MPRKNINYSKTLMYKIVCNDLSVTDVYTGSTTDFVRRKSQHKNNMNSSDTTVFNRKLYDCIRKNGGWENWTMVLIEKYPCNDKNESLARERYWYDKLNCKNMNTLSPLQTDDERKKKTGYMVCSCGLDILYKKRNSHLNDQRHTKALTVELERQAYVERKTREIIGRL